MRPTRTPDEATAFGAMIRRAGDAMAREMARLFAGIDPEKLRAEIRRQIDDAGAFRAAMARPPVHPPMIAPARRGN